MADLTITAANVAAGSGARNKTGVAGESLTAGGVVFVDAADNKEIKKATCADTAAKAAAVGVVLVSASSGQTVVYQTTGRITIGATVAVGETYVLSEAGAICPIADLASSDFVTYIGYGVSTTQIELGIKATGLEKA